MTKSEIKQRISDIEVSRKVLSKEMKELKKKLGEIENQETYTGDVICIADTHNTGGFCTGNIYHVEDGHVENDFGEKVPKTFAIKDFEQFCEWFGCYKWMEVFDSNSCKGWYTKVFCVGSNNPIFTKGCIYPIVNSVLRVEYNCGYYKVYNALSLEHLNKETGCRFIEVKV